MKRYIICMVDGDDLYVREKIQGRLHAEARELAGFHVSHWDSEISGDLPPITDIDSPVAWEDTRGYSEKRRCGYRMDSDKKLLEFRGRVDGDGDSEAEARADWIADRNRIKDKYLKPWAACSVDAGTDTITVASHGFANGDLVDFSATTLPGGISEDTKYYVINKATDTFQISATEGGAAIDITSNGSEVQYRRRYVA
jgi:hypothetical protein